MASGRHQRVARSDEPGSSFRPRGDPGKIRSASSYRQVRNELPPRYRIATAARRDNAVPRGEPASIRRATTDATRSAHCAPAGPGASVPTIVDEQSTAGRPGKSIARGSMTWSRPSERTRSTLHEVRSAYPVNLGCERLASWRARRPPPPDPRGSALLVRAAPVPCRARAWMPCRPRTGTPAASWITNVGSQGSDEQLFRAERTRAAGPALFAEYLVPRLALRNVWGPLLDDSCDRRRPRVPLRLGPSGRDANECGMRPAGVPSRRGFTEAALTRTITSPAVHRWQMSSRTSTSESVCAVDDSLHPDCLNTL